MPRYRVEKLSWIGGRNVKPGEEIEFAGIPGTALTPLDDDAKAAKLAADTKRLPPKPGSMALVGGRHQVEIPKNWEQETGPALILLARKLGAPAKGTTAKVATTIIKDELARRATV